MSKNYWQTIIIVILSRRKKRETWKQLNRRWQIWRNSGKSGPHTYTNTVWTSKCFDNAENCEDNALCIVFFLPFYYNWYLSILYFTVFANIRSIIYYNICISIELFWQKQNRAYAPSLYVSISNYLFYALSFSGG